MKNLVTGIILAGGRGSRFGGADKGLLDYQGKPLVAHISEALKPQVTRILIVANRNLDAYRRYGDQVLTDNLPDFGGPLAGIHSGLTITPTPYALIVACDMPQLPSNIVEIMYATLTQHNADVCVTRDAVGLQPFPMLVAVSKCVMSAAHAARAHHPVMRWLETQVVEVMSLDEHAKVLNINTPGDLKNN